VRTQTIVIDKRTGTTRFLYADNLAPLLQQGEATVRRASHVEPTDPADPSKGWSADMAPSGGPVLGPFPTRQAALDAECAWLLARHLQA